MIHRDAVEVAMQCLRRLAPACERVCIAGSIRRHKPCCKDVEIVYIPRMAREKVDLFSYDDVPRTEGRIRALAEDGFWTFDQEVKRNGPKYKRLIHTGSSMTIELFRAWPQNWGLVMAIRTGPADFNKILVNRFGGAMPVDMQMRDGHLWRRNNLVETPTETAFFNALDLPYWAPQIRTTDKLRSYLGARRI